MTDTLKVVDAEALVKAIERFESEKKYNPRLRGEWEEILADITTDDLSPAHRESGKYIEEVLREASSA